MNKNNKLFDIALLFHEGIYSIILILILITNSNLHSQTIEKNFILKGKININSGSVVLQPIGGLFFNPKIKNNYKAKIINGRFIFKGKISYPSGFILMIYPSYRSGTFIIEPGSQEIACNVDSTDIIPNINNKSMFELRMLSNQLLKLNNQIDTINFLYKMEEEKHKNMPKTIQDSMLNKFNNETERLDLNKKQILCNFTKQHPTSFVSLWRLVELSENGYEPILDSIYSSLSPAIKNNYTGKILFEVLSSSRVTAVGHKFPSIMLTDIKNKKVSLKTSEMSKFTLIDLWYSKCGPCIRDFPKHKEIFSKYNKDGYEVIGISVDKRQDIAAWKAVIKIKSLPWKQYLDINGEIISNKLSISLFPSNFLLDKKGIIIKKNINLMELDDFLKNNLLK
jgi:peroxiredoxin